MLWLRARHWKKRHGRSRSHSTIIIKWNKEGKSMKKSNCWKRNGISHKTTHLTCHYAVTHFYSNRERRSRWALIAELNTEPESISVTVEMLSLAWNVSPSWYARCARCRHTRDGKVARKGGKRNTSRAAQTEMDKLQRQVRWWRRTIDHLTILDNSRWSNDHSCTEKKNGEPQKRTNRMPCEIDEARRSRWWVRRTAVFLTMEICLEW